MVSQRGTTFVLVQSEPMDCMYTDAMRRKQLPRIWLANAVA